MHMSMPDIVKIQRQKRQNRLRYIIIVLAIVLFGVSIVVNVIDTINPPSYWNTHDIPNPTWGMYNGGYTYTPQQGPPGPGLLNSRPEDTFLQFFHDYMMVFGTIPCAQPTSSDANDILDQVRVPNIGQTVQCANTRVVQSMEITQVQVVTHNAFNGYWVGAMIYFTVRYTNGTLWQANYILLADPEYSQKYYSTYIHLDCWSGDAAGVYAGIYDGRGSYYDQHHLPYPTTKGMEYLNNGSPTSDFYKDLICNR